MHMHINRKQREPHYVQESERTITAVREIQMNKVLPVAAIGLRQAYIIASIVAFQRIRHTQVFHVFCNLIGGA